MVGSLTGLFLLVEFVFCWYCMFWACYEFGVCCSGWLFVVLGVGCCSYLIRCVGLLGVNSVDVGGSLRLYFVVYLVIGVCFDFRLFGFRLFSVALYLLCLCLCIVCLGLFWCYRAFDWCVYCVYGRFGLGLYL